MSNGPVKQNQFEQAVRTAQHGDLANGYRLMRQVLLADPSYAPAWFWMSRLVDDTRRKRECLERALALDPGLRPARDALDSLQAHEQQPAQSAPAPEPQKLGTYLIKRGLITPGQLEVGLMEQRGGQTWGKRMPLGDILIRRGILTPQDLAAALMMQLRDRLRAGGGKRPERLGEYLIVSKQVSPEQLAAALAEQARLRQRGQYIVLGELLLRRGYLKSDSLERVLDRQRQDFFGVLDN
jgi:hypothetical protein